MSGSIDECFYPSDFYRVMEAQRLKLPRMTRQKYAPIFIIDTLRDKLESMETPEHGKDNNDSLPPSKKIKLQAEESEKWTEDSLLDGNFTNFEGTYLIEDKNGKDFIKHLLMFAVLLKGTPGIGLDPFEFPRLFCREVRTHLGIYGCNY